MSVNLKEKEAFIVISNWGLDEAKMNWAIFLAISDIILDDIGKTITSLETFQL